ncbi:polyprenyl synthetase family protein [Schlesneria paludicola]|uniref:polyprenyl synthetase family protein n=1 Tax=Schlesneria paludicola TaxID=360056 RepID=UPI00029A13D1|nr:polyprenyl synthetase family protein [Schlesneria paludicola]
MIAATHASAVNGDEETKASDVARPNVVDSESSKPTSEDKPRRRSTSHLKLVPETLELREQIREAAEHYATQLDKRRPFNKNELEAHGRKLLEQLGQPEGFLGFAMVLVGNAFWKQQFLAIPFERRLLLLPHCLKHADGCPAEYDEFGLDCEKCGACSIADYKVRAEQLGYKVLVAEGSPIVLKIIVSGHIDGILGVACLNVLEKAIDKVLLAGVPSYAVPLHSGDCKNTKLDESWVWHCLDKYVPLEDSKTSGYIPLMRASNQVFDEQLDEVLPLARQGASDTLLAETESVARQWLVQGGKRLRPFITLAAYDALTGAAGLQAQSNDDLAPFSLGVRRTAMAMEAFHKASLVHDDIQDNDDYRYGQETLHRRYGVATAINIGDYLIGLGYRLISQSRKELGAEAASDILDRLASAHLKLCEGQGAELRWTGADAVKLTALDAMKLYALKTSPAFEAALYAGLRLAGPMDAYEAMVPAFSRHIGVGFQILNDLLDWEEAAPNKMVAGRDAEMAKPTILLALALEAAKGPIRVELEKAITAPLSATVRAEQLRRLYQKLGVFEKAQALVDKCRSRAEALADAIEPEPLRQLLYFLTDTVLADSTTPTPQVTLVPLSVQLPIIGHPVGTT